MTEITKPLVVKTIAEFRAAIAEALVAAQEKLDAQARAAAAEMVLRLSTRMRRWAMCRPWVPSTTATLI